MHSTSNFLAKVSLSTRSHISSTLICNEGIHRKLLSIFGISQLKCFVKMVKVFWQLLFTFQQVKLVYTYERFSVLSIKSLNQTFLPFLDRKPWWEKHILFVKQTIPHQFTLTLKGVCWLLKSNPGGAVTLLVHFIINPTSKSQSATTSYIFDIFEKKLDISLY